MDCRQEGLLFCMTKIIRKNSNRVGSHVIIATEQKKMGVSQKYNVRMVYMKPLVQEVKYICVGNLHNPTTKIFFTVCELQGEQKQHI